MVISKRNHKCNSCGRMMIKGNTGRIVCLNSPMFNEKYTFFINWIPPSHAEHFNMSSLHIINKHVRLLSEEEEALIKLQT